MAKIVCKLSLLVGFLTMPWFAAAAWDDMLKPLSGALHAPGTEIAGSGLGLSQQEIAAGLKQALGIGTQRAVEYLGQDGGFLNDAEVRIPLPGSLQQVERGLRAVGQEGLADEFIATMNHAAEQAVPEAAGIFGDAIENMTLQDAQAILQGPDDAATDYFRKSSGDRLREAMLPIVGQATERTGATAAYKRFVGNAGGGLLGSLVGGTSLDLDAYVTDKALDGLFLKLAEQEALIRQNPAARSTELLQQVFGAVGK